MKTESTYQPPFAITPLALRHIADISETVGRISAQTDGALDLRLRRLNRTALFKVRSPLKVTR